jgi:hypothetical protein
MFLKILITKSYYGSVGYISSEDDLDLLEQYILYNLPILKQFINIITSTTYLDNNNLHLHNKLSEIWKKYFPNSYHINLGKSRGHSFGTSDNDNAIFDYCKENNIEWLCKSANDVIFQESILNKEIEEADFYYLNGIGFGGMIKYNFDFDKIIEEDFYPQTNFYFINTSKIDFLNDKNHIDEIYNKVKNISNYNGKAWEYGFKSCEGLLKECINRNNLSKYHLISSKKYRILLKLIKDCNIHDPSHKNIMIDGICHFQYNNQQIVEL